MFQEEKDYILTNIAASTKRPARRFPPMRQLLTSPPFLVIVLVHFGNNWANYTLMSGTALFLANIHHFDLAAVSGKNNHITPHNAQNHFSKRVDNS